MTDLFELAFDEIVESATGVQYRCVQRLGQGRNATTYLMVAEDGPHRGIPFAVKFFRRLSKPEWKEAFLREAEFLQSCAHPAVMRYFDRGLAKGQNPFFVAEYLPDTLRAVIRTDRTSIVLKLSFATQLLSSLSYLADRPTPVVHRDIKPENIFIKGQSAVLGDFGLIKLLPDTQGDSEVLLSSAGPGMPRQYRTPDLVEYLRGGPVPSPKSDDYQLGLVLIELLTGRNPQVPLLDGEPFQTPVRIKPLLPVSGDIGSVLSGILESMLRSDQAARPSARELMDVWQGGLLSRGTTGASTRRPSFFEPTNEVIMFSDFRLILRKFVRNAKTVATVAPSSRFLSRAILHGIDWSKTKCVVELGAGTGPVTAELVKQAPPGTRVIVNEFLPEFCEVLRKKFPTVEIIEGDARDLSQMLANLGVTQVDHVLSGLPLTHFSASDRDTVIDRAATLLAPEGTFRQLTTAPWLYQGLYRRYFRDVSFRLVARNIPPGGVYTCRGWIPSEQRGT